MPAFGSVLASGAATVTQNVAPLATQAANGVKSSAVLVSKSTTDLISHTTPLVALSASSVLSAIVVSHDELKELIGRNIIPAAKALTASAAPHANTILSALATSRKQMSPYIASAAPYTSAILNAVEGGKGNDQVYREC